MADSSDLDRLYEELMLERTLEEPCMPLFTNFTKNINIKTLDVFWSFWGGHKVPTYWNPKNIKTICYRNKEGKFHRTAGPALINSLYDEEGWFYEGKLHNENNWAYRKGGNFVWFRHGVLHNLHGPAVIDMAGPCQYWIDGIKFSKNQYKWEISRRKRKGKL